jgi:hypothetical protein
MAKKDPTEDSAFQKVIGVFLSTSHKPQKTKRTKKIKASRKKAAT